MTDSDIERIKRELKITLPKSYKKAVVPFLVPALMGNTDWKLWDNAERLIALNLALRRSEIITPLLPSHLFAIGDSHNGGVVLLDTADAYDPVFWCGLDDNEMHGIQPSQARFADWAEEFYRSTRSLLEAGGYDPDGSPEHLRVSETASVGERIVVCLGLVVVIVLAIVLYFCIRR